MFLRNVGLLSLDYTKLYPRRQLSVNINSEVHIKHTNAPCEQNSIFLTMYIHVKMLETKIVKFFRMLSFFKVLFIMKVSFFQYLSYCRLYGNNKPVAAYSLHKTIIIFREIFVAVTLYTYLTISSECIFAQKDIAMKNCL